MPPLAMEPRAGLTVSLYSECCPFACNTHRRLRFWVDSRQVHHDLAKYQQNNDLLHDNVFCVCVASGSRATGGAAGPGRPSSSNGAAAAGTAAAPKQKAGKVVFAGGNRLAAKQAAAKEQKVRMLTSLFWGCLHLTCYIQCTLC